MARYFVTGAQGCIGAWVVKNLMDRGQDVFVFDLDLEPKRLGLLLNTQGLSRVQFIRGDVCDSEQISAEIQRQKIDYIIHLAGLQVPTCRANPRLGAMVNVVGTINVFEAARARGKDLQGLVYASSAAVFGPEEDYGATPLDESPSAARNALWSFQTVQRGECASVLQGPAALERWITSLCCLWAGPRFWNYLRPNQSLEGGRRRQGL